MKSHEIQHFFIPFLHPVLSEFSGFKLTDGTPVTFRLYVDNLAPARSTCLWPEHSVETWGRWGKKHVKHKARKCWV